MTKEKFIGKWVSKDANYKDFEFSLTEWMKNTENGKWAVQGNEIWLINADLEHGTKWCFSFESNNTLMLHSPEDFIYQGGNNYIYLQFSNPKLKIRFERMME